MKQNNFLFFLLGFWLCCGPPVLGQTKTEENNPDTTNFINFFLNKRVDMGYDIHKNAETNELYALERYSVRDTHLFEYDFFSGKIPTDKNIIGIGLKPMEQNKIKGQTMVRTFSKTYLSYQLDESLEVEILAMGIRPQNKDSFEYRIVKDDSIEIKEWQVVNTFGNKYGAKKPFAIIGKFRESGKKLLIEIRNKKNIAISDGVILSWKKPVKPQMVWGQITIKNEDANFTMSSIFNSTTVSHPYVKKFDNATGLPLDLEIPSGIEENEVSGTYRLQFGLSEHYDAPYEVSLKKNINGRIDTVTVEPSFVDQMLEVPGNFLKQPGLYELIIRSKVEKDNSIIFRFKVLSPPLLYKKTSLKQLLPYGLATLSGVAFLFIAYQQINRRKLIKEKRAKEFANQQLKAVRAQLNPHFMSNALTSIQNLMNKNELKQANQYLSKFSNLTRTVLNTTENELISLDEELAILREYMEMEQLRFGFHYEINCDPDINSANIEVPAMLLQPFVENAVKHGISTLQQEGFIEIAVAKDGKHLLLIVSDNGRGFAQKKQSGSKSFGLKLSEDRIAYLNEVYNDQKASFNIDSQNTGTVVTLKLENWM